MTYMRRTKLMLFIMAFMILISCINGKFIEATCLTTMENDPYLSTMTAGQTATIFCKYNCLPSRNSWGCNPFTSDTPICSAVYFVSDVIDGFNFTFVADGSHNSYASCGIVNEMDTLTMEYGYWYKSYWLAGISTGGVEFGPTEKEWKKIFQAEAKANRDTGSSNSKKTTAVSVVGAMGVLVGFYVYKRRLKLAKAKEEAARLVRLHSEPITLGMVSLMDSDDDIDGIEMENDLNRTTKSDMNLTKDWSLI